MTERKKVRIAGLGSHAPEKTLTNADLESMVETSDEWITKRCGIKKRHVAAEDEAASDIGAVAAKKAIKSAGIDPLDVDMIYFATSSPDRIVPASAPYLQAKTGCWNAGAVDMLAACSGFLYAINAAWHAVAMGQSKCCLVVGSETLSKIVNYGDRSTCILFGDAAGAAVIVPSEKEESDILWSRMGCDGRLTELIIVPAGGSAMMPNPENIEKRLDKIHMQGREVYKYAVPKFVELIRGALKETGLSLDDLRGIVPHQMNLRMMEAVAERLEMPMDKMFMSISEFGNTSSASIPLVMDRAVQAGQIKRGDLLLMTAMGAGITWGTMVLRY